VYKRQTFWSPNINIFRDPRWGRGQETYGEDPYLTTVMGIAFIKGLQGNHPEYLKLVATPKHFAVHSGPERDRHHFDARVGERDFRETYLPAFEACVKEAQAASIMGAYNRINGEPCCASRTLLEKILKDEWGFEGFVVSDCGAILDIYAHHQVVDTAAQASSLAVKNGCDLNCGNVYPALLEAVEQGLISEEIVTQAVERLFRARFRLGMFDPEETVPYTGIPYDVVDSKEHRELALEAARQSIVLLKNEYGLLPLSKDIHSIAVIGPNADDLGSLLGNYNGTPREPITPLKGIRNILPPKAKVYYAQGCEIAADVLPMNPIPPAYLRPDKVAGDTEGLKASYYQSTNFTGEPSVVCVDPCVDFIWKDTTPLSGKWGHPFAVRWSGYLVPPESGIYRLGVNGFNQYHLYLDGSCIVEYDDIHHPVLKSKDVHLEAEHAYPIRLDYVNIGLDPQVRLLWSMPRRDYQTEALNIARQAEVLVLVMGLSPALEGEEMPVQVQGFTGGDRTDISLPRPQLELLKSMHALGKPVILVLQNGSALAVGWADENIPAILEAWYPGQAGGQALAEVIFGDFNPSGRLPLTFYKALEDLPPFENYAMAGRTYRYFEGQPLYPFGHGLSYTTFSYSDLQIRPAQIKAGAQVTVRCDVTNTGDRAGDEVVQLYLRHRGVPDPAPIKELKGFGHISLEPGESKTVEFTLGTAQLRSYVEAEGWYVHPGVVDVMVGRSSIDLPLNGQFEVMGTSTLVKTISAFRSKMVVK